MLLLDVREKIYHFFQCDKNFSNYLFTHYSDDVYAKYYTAMYLIQDTGEALMAHRKMKFSINPFSAYIEFWGVMQAIYIQQDCIKGLWDIFISEVAFEVKSCPYWKKLRKLRNRCAGHPLETDQKQRSFIGRNSINYQQVKYETYNFSSKPAKINKLRILDNIEHQTINLGETLDEYDKEAAIKLDFIFNKMQTLISNE